MWMFLPGLVLELIGIGLLVFGLVTSRMPVIFAAICLLVIAVVVHLVQFTMRSRSCQERAEPGDSGAPAQPKSSDTSKVLYADRLIMITENAITFVNFSFPFQQSRRVGLAEINHVDVFKPALANGKYKMWGSGIAFSLWFPLDACRSSRDRIFHAYLKDRWMNIGFTVERSDEVTGILKSKGLIGKEE